MVAHEPKITLITINNSGWQRTCITVTFPVGTVRTDIQILAHIRRKS